MVTYEVTATVAPSLAAAYEQYMRAEHIPELLATGHFTGASFARGSGGRYRIRYEAPSQEALDAYLRDHAPRLRAGFARRFPDVQLSREVWQVVQVWPAPPAPED